MMRAIANRPKVLSRSAEWTTPKWTSPTRQRGKLAGSLIPSLARRASKLKLGSLLRLGIILFSSCQLSASCASETEPKLAIQSHALVDSVERKDWRAFEKLFNVESARNATQPDGMSALHWATVHGAESAVQELLKLGSDPNAKTRYGVTPLSIACRSGNATLVQALLAAGGDANLELPGGETTLMIAARAGYTDVAQALLKVGAQVDATDRRGQTALMWAAAAGHAHMITALVSAGADWKRELKSGFTALMFAAREGQLEAVEALVAAGADVNETMSNAKGGGRKPRKGTSPLMLAVESGHFQLALRLVELGADPNDQRSGFTPLHAVTWVRKTNRGDDPSGDPPPRGSGNVTSLEFFRRLIEMGANVNTQLDRGKPAKAKLTLKGATPFLMAAKTADLPLMKVLFELGADPQITNVDGTTPLMATMGIGVVAVGEEAGTEPEVLAAGQWLLERGIDINAKDENGETAMHGAAYRNFPRVVDFLAANGADPAIWDAKNNYGWTPTMIAQGKRPGSLKPSPETIAALATAKQSIKAKPID